MTPKYRRPMSFLVALSIGLALAGCATTEPPTQTAILADALPETTVIPGKWASAAEAGEVPDGWLKSYHDPRMEAVVGEALKNNLGLRTASANLDAAAGAAKIAGARLKPTVGLGGGGSSQTTSGGGGPSQSYGADINVGAVGRRKATALISMSPGSWISGDGCAHCQRQVSKSSRLRKQTSNSLVNRWQRRRRNPGTSPPRRCNKGI